MRQRTNMYPLSVKQWNPYVCCYHFCSYCEPSFQRQLKRWAKGHCRLCYDWVPHEHEERLGQKLPKTKFMQFIFACANGDIAFCPKPFLKRILTRIREEGDKVFLIQTKNPKALKGIDFPENVILGTTLETNRDDLYYGISNAPLPSVRYMHFLDLDHELKMVTHEPIIDFDVDVLLEWDREICPCMIWIGYDSKRNYLPEPELEKVKTFHWELGKLGYVVVLKTIRKAWWE